MLCPSRGIWKKWSTFSYMWILRLKLDRFPVLSIKILSTRLTNNNWSIFDLMCSSCLGMEEEMLMTSCIVFGPNLARGFSYFDADFRAYSKSFRSWDIQQKASTVGRNAHALSTRHISSPSRCVCFGLMVNVSDHQSEGRGFEPR